MGQWSAPVIFESTQIASMRASTLRAEAHATALRRQLVFDLLTYKRIGRMLLLYV